MTVLFGHPTGNPNSHHAALAHLEAGWLEAFCVPWMPSVGALGVLEGVPPIRSMAQRLARRRFAPLADAPLVEGRVAEWGRLALRALGRDDERLSYAANDWLMRTMRRECRRPTVTAVHAYEECSAWQFEEARRLGKACIYDMPIGYYEAWEETQLKLARNYPDWLPSDGLPSDRYARPAQKRREMELADLVLVPCSFVERTIRTFHPHKKLARATYGVDLEYWHPATERAVGGNSLRFLYAGQLSLRKGIPILLSAWEAAALGDAELELVGAWQLADSKRVTLPRGVSWSPPCSRNVLRNKYRAADVFVFPSFFEGFGLVLLEAMACGLPAIASEATAGPDILTDKCGRVVPAGSIEALVDSFRWFYRHQDRLPEMRCAAREQAERFTWENYRNNVIAAVTPFV